MGLRISSFFCVALLVLAGCGVDPTNVNQQRAASALQTAGVAGKDFVDASTAQGAAVKHTPSGMVCPLPTNGDFSLSSSGEGDENPGASCTIASGSVATSYLAIAFKDAPSLDAVFNDALQRTVGQGAAQTWPGDPSAADKADPAGLPHFRIGRFQLAIGGEPRYLRVAMAEADGWYLQQFVSAPLSDAVAQEYAAGTEWRLLLGEFAKAHAAH